MITPLTSTLSRESKSSPGGSSPSRHPPLNLEDCGLSLTFAYQFNCIFDPILTGWVSFQCHDAHCKMWMLQGSEEIKELEVYSYLVGGGKVP